MAYTAFHLRSDEWSSFQIPSVVSPALVAGDLFLKDDVVCIAPESYSVGEKGVGIYKAKKVYLPKATGTGHAFNIGDIVCADLANNRLDVAASGFYVVGICTENASITDTGVEVDFDGTGAANGAI